MFGSKGTNNQFASYKRVTISGSALLRSGLGQRLSENGREIDSSAKYAVAQTTQSGNLAFNGGYVKVGEYFLLDEGLYEV
jgi:hypothetical protein